MFKRAARCSYRAKFRAIKLRRWKRVCKSVMTKAEAKVCGNGNLSQSNLGNFYQEFSCCHHFWLAFIARCLHKVRTDCIFCYSLQNAHGCGTSSTTSRTATEEYGHRLEGPLKTSFKYYIIGPAFICSLGVKMPLVSLENMLPLRLKTLSI